MKHIYAHIISECYFKIRVYVAGFLFIGGNLHNFNFTIHTGANVTWGLMGNCTCPLLTDNF